LIYPNTKLKFQGVLWKELSKWLTSAMQGQLLGSRHPRDFTHG